MAERHTPGSGSTSVDEERSEKSSSIMQDANNSVSYPYMGTVRYVSLVLCMAMAMILNIYASQCTILAMTKIGDDLDVKVVDLQWLSTAYAVAFGSFLLLFGRIADIYGHKMVFIAGAFWLCVWSIGCGFVRSEIGLFIMRAFQGMGSAAIVPAAMGILGDNIAPGPRKSVAFATFSGGAPIGASMSYVFSGILTTWAPAGWRSVFYLTAGISALIGILAFFVIPPHRGLIPKNTTVDWIGAFLITAGLILFTFALAQCTAVSWRTAYVPVTFSLGIVLIIAFWFWERYLEVHTTRPPLMQTSIWSRGRFAVVQIVGLFGWSSFASYSFFATLFYSDYRHLTPILMTVRFLPMPVTGLTLNLIFALVAARVPAQVLFILGAIGTSLASTLFAAQSLTAPYWQYQFPAMIVSVFGADFVFATGIMYVSRTAGPGQQALAGGLFNMMTQTGTALGLAICTIVQNNVTSRESSKLGVQYDINAANAPPFAVWKGLQMAMTTAAAFGAGNLIITITSLYGIGRVGQKHTLKPAQAVDGASEAAPGEALVDAEGEVQQGDASVEKAQVASEKLEV